MRHLLASSLDAADAPTVYLASRDGEAMSTVTATHHGATAGIWRMATPPAHRRKGVGRALLTSVMEGLSRVGVARSYLLATEAGRPLYESLGFRATHDCRAFVLGHSTQMER
jgi:GNAT superfamily N-acetyltransferase